MTKEQYMKNLLPPEGKVDIVLDTDAYNEIDDQYAISYMLLAPEKFNVKGICAAPFLNSLSDSAEDGMVKSYNEIFNLLTLAGKEEVKDIVYEGSRTFLPDENTPVESPAADFMAELANEYSPENPLYIVAIGAITNVASAILKNPKMKENTVIVWLGGHTPDWPFPAEEFNMVQDIAAARIVFGCGVPLIHIPALGATDRLTVTKYELEHWLLGKNPLANYLAEHTIECADGYAKDKPWSRVIWDISAIAWFFSADKRMRSNILPAVIPEYDKTYTIDNTRHLISRVYHIHRDGIFEDLFNRLTK